MINIEQINFEKMNGLVPAVVQDVSTREVLMMGFMNREALVRTLEDGKATFWTRTKNRFWTKGETSGNFLMVEEVRSDCDNDSILVLARPAGPTCHTNERSCFGEKSRGVGFLGKLFDVIQSRKVMMPEGSYTTSLFKGGIEEILAKVEEESEEVIRASREETQARLVEETGDLLYHLMVLLVEKKISLDDVMQLLEMRQAEVGRSQYRLQ